MSHSPELVLEIGHYHSYAFGRVLQCPPEAFDRFDENRNSGFSLRFRPSRTLGVILMDADLAVFSKWESHPHFFHQFQTEELAERAIEYLRTLVTNYNAETPKRPRGVYIPLETLR